MITPYLRTVRSFNRDVHLFLISIGLVGFAFDGGIYTLLFNLYLLRLGHGPEFIGLLNGVGPLGFAFFSLLAGALGGRWGSRWTMLLGLSLMLIGCGSLPLAEFSPVTWQTGWLSFNFILIFCGLAMYLVNATPFLMEAATVKERTHVFSAQIAIFFLAGFTGSLVGGFLPGFFATTFGLTLEQPGPYRYPLLLAAFLLLPAIAAIIATDKVHPEPKAAADIKPKPGRGPRTLLYIFPVGLVTILMVVRFFQIGAVAISMTFFNVYMDAALQVSTAQIGTLSGLGRLLAVPLALATPLMVTRWGKGPIIVWVSFAVAISMLPLALIPHWSAAGMGYIGVMAMSSVRLSTFLPYSMELVAPHLRALVSGLGEMAAGLSFAAMGLGGGYLITAWGYSPLFLVGAGFSAMGGLIFWTYFRIPRGELAHQPVV